MATSDIRNPLPDCTPVLSLETANEIFPDNGGDGDPLLASLGRSEKGRVRDLAILRILMNRAEATGNLARHGRETLARLAQELAQGNAALHELLQDHCRDMLRRHAGLWLLDPPGDRGPEHRNAPEWAAVATRLNLFEAVYVRAEMIASNSIGNRLAFAFGQNRPLDELNLVSRGDLGALAEYFRTPIPADPLPMQEKPAQAVPMPGLPSGAARMESPPARARRRFAGWLSRFARWGEA